MPATRPRGRRDVRSGLVTGLFLLLSVSLLVGTLGLSVSMLRQTADLGQKVRLTEGIVDANVRTLSQVQRELLKLDVLLSSDHPQSSAIDLQESLVAQRIQEGSLSYQRQTLGAEALLQESRRLATVWHQQVQPLVAGSRGTGAAARTSRTRAIAGIEQLERGYNQLVSDGEINRKLEAAKANRGTTQMVGRAHRLVWGLAVTFLAIVLMLVTGAVVYSRFHRQRERAAANVLELNVHLARYAEAVRSTDSLVVITGPEGTVEWVNDAFVRAAGFAADDVAGHGLLDLFQPGEGADELAQHLRTGRRFNEQVRLRLRDGGDTRVNVDVGPVHDESGRLTGFVLVGVDATEQYRTESLLRQAAETAEASAREKATFLATMSHEIRTPLNAVLGLTDLLLLTELDPTQREYVSTAHSSGRLLLALVNDILDFSALESGRLETEQRVFELRKMLTETVDMFRADAQLRGVGLRVELAAGLPEHVRGDETRLRQILVNLIGNGLKFTEVGEVRLEVSGAAPDSAGLMRFSVVDSGIGIPAERRARLFQPFTQADASTTRRYGGTGLGLAICRLLAERLGGRISVDSELGRGSRFVVELPMVAARPAEPEAGDEAVEEGPRLDRLRVLLAEDDLVNQTVAVAMLRRLGIEPVVVGDGAAAVAQVRQADFDLVMMDVHMPGVDGLQATAQIRADGPGPRIAAVTANSLEGDRERFLAAGMDDYISKPMRLDDLQGLLRRAVAAPV